MKYIIISTLFLLTACSEKSKNITIIKYERGDCIINHDLDKLLESNVPQDIDLFKNQAIKYERQFQAKQKELNKKFNEIFFTPWNDKYEYSSIDFVWINNVLKSDEIAGENLQKYSFSEKQEFVSNAFENKKIMKRGITIRDTLLKIIPTNKPLFLNIKEPGNCFPFDYNNGLVNAKIGVPVFILYQSKDKKWFYADTFVCSGWIDARDIAFVDDSFVKDFSSSKLSVAIKDDSILEHNDDFICSANIATILPIKNNYVMVPYKKSNGFAKMILCKSDGFVEKPFLFTANNAALVAKGMLGKKYGWGGSFGNRDCSMCTQDFMTVFGKYIPRNSGAQLSAGIDIKKYDKSEKLKFLKQNLVPFLSIIGEKGHVMLFVGFYNDQPVFLNNKSGLKIGNNFKSRFIIGKTVLNTIDFEKYLLNEESEIMIETSSHIRNFLAE